VAVPSSHSELYSKVVGAPLSVLVVVSGTHGSDRSVPRYVGRIQLGPKKDLFRTSGNDPKTVVSLVIVEQLLGNL
jgi:hypothetical protein